VWYDYISVPQKSAIDTNWVADQAAAIRCIPQYVDNCVLFVVLVPALDHLTKHGSTVEMVTWSKRGWCRMEKVAKQLCSEKNEGPVIVLQSRKQMFFLPQANPPQAIGAGQFG
jgi:hypothetical protein